MQPSGNLHLGNYLGALKNFVSLQNESSCIYCVVDLHAITTFQNPKLLKNNILETTASFLASGLDENKSIIFKGKVIAEGNEDFPIIFQRSTKKSWGTIAFQGNQTQGSILKNIISNHKKKLKKHSIDLIIRQIVREIINEMVKDIILTTNKNIKKY